VIEKGMLMDTTAKTRAAICNLIGVAMLVATACASGTNPAVSPGGANGYGASGSAAIGPSGSSDPLVGTWQSAPFTSTDVDALLRGQFKHAAVNAMEAVGGCLPKEGDTHVTTLSFGAGQLVISDSKNGGVSQEGWTGSYVVQDVGTFAAGGADNLYITVNYKMEGNRLFTDLIADRFPDHTPWSVAQDGPSAAKLNGIVDKPLADSMCQAAIYEATPFTKVG
jgi:hypothetical protein